MNIVQIILVSLAGVSLIIFLIAFVRGRRHSDAAAVIGSMGLILAIVFALATLLAGCGNRATIHDWHRSLQESVFRGQCWSDEGHGCYSKTIGTVSCVAILSGGVYHLSMGYYGIHDGGYRRECVLAVEAIQAFEHYAAQRNPYHWDQARADSMRLRYCGHRTEEEMQREAMKVIQQHCQHESETYIGSKSEDSLRLSTGPIRADTLAPHVPYDSLLNMLPYGYRLIRVPTHQHGFRLIRIPTHQPEANYF